MPIQSSLDTLIVAEIDSLANRSRHLQQMLILLGCVDERVLVDFRGAVDDLREVSDIAKLWISAAPEEKRSLITRLETFRQNSTERNIRGILADIHSRDKEQPGTEQYVNLGRLLRAAQQPCSSD